MEENVIISSSQENVVRSTANVSLIKFNTITQSLIGIVLMSFVATSIVVVVVLVVTGVSYEPPVARPDSFTAYKNVPTAVYPLLNDYDPKGGKLSIAAASKPMYGTVRISPDAKYIVYTSSKYYAGPDSFFYTITDQKLNATSYINVTVLDTPPIPVNFVFTVPVNSIDNAFPLFNLSTNGQYIVDPEGDPMFIANATQPRYGEVYFTEDVLYFTPGFNFVGTENITYTISDYNLTVTANITFEMIVLTPLTQPDSYILKKDRIHTLNILENDFDPNNSTLIIESVGFSFAPVYIFNGNTQVVYQCLPKTEPYTDSFEYTVIDGFNATAISYVTLSIVNTPPVAYSANATVYKNSVSKPINLLYTDVDTMDIHTITVGEPAHGSITLKTITVNKRIPYAGQLFHIPYNYFSIVYKPDIGFAGTDVFNFTISDFYATDTASIFIQIETLPPVAANLSFSNIANIPLLLNLTLNSTNPNGDPNTLSSFKPIQTALGGLITQVNSSFALYSPPYGKLGTDSFSYVLYDATDLSLSSTGIVEIELYDVAPIIVSTIVTNCSRYKSTWIYPLNNARSPSNSTLTLETENSIPSVSGATISQIGNGINFTCPSVPATVTFSINVTDSFNLSTAATVTVICYDLPPTAVNETVSVLWNNSITISASVNDTDPYNVPIYLYSYTPPKNGTVIMKNNNFIYTPNNGFVGMDIFTYVVTDGYELSNSAFITVNVYDNPPQVNTTYYTGHWSKSSTINVLANCYDPDQNPLAIKQILNYPEYGTAQVVSGGILYTPSTNPGHIGVFNLSYIVTDWHYDEVGYVVLNLTDIYPVAQDIFVNLHWRLNNTIINVFGSNNENSYGDQLYIYNITQPPSIGSAFIVDAAQGTINYTEPIPQVLGNVTIQYDITDTVLVSQSATITIDVTNVAVPQAFNITQSVQWRDLMNGNKIVFNVLTSTTDSDGDPLYIYILNQPINGSAQVNSATSISYNLIQPWEGIASFDYMLSDGLENTTATITITVYDNGPIPANISISLNPSQLDGYYIDVISQVYEQDSQDAPYLQISYINQSEVVEGAVASIDGGRIYYKVAYDWTGYNVFHYIVSDGLKTGEAYINVSVVLAQASPQDQYYTYHWKNVENGIDLNLLQNISAVYQANLTGQFFNVSTGVNLSLVDTQTVRFKPEPGFIGVETFTAQYSANDSTSNIYVTITITNNPPTFYDQSFNLEWFNIVYGYNISISNYAYDVDGDNVTLYSVNLIQGNGTIIAGYNTSVIEYQPPPPSPFAYQGQVLLNVTVTDGISYTSRNFTLTIQCQPPTIYSKTYSLHWSDYLYGYNLNILSSSGGSDAASDPNNLSLSLYSVGPINPSAAGSVVINSTMVTITGKPPAYLVGNSMQFPYTVTNGGCASTSTVTVGITDSIPNFGTAFVSVQWREVNYTINVISQPNLSNGDTLSIEPNVTSSVNSYAVGVGPNITYTPSYKYLGPDVLIYTYTDGLLFQNATLNVTVYDDAPHTVDISYPSMYWKEATNYSFVFDVLGNPGVYDIDALDQGFLYLYLPNGTNLNGNSYVINGSNITIALAPSEVSPGTIKLPYYVSDGLLNSTSNLIIYLNDIFPGPSDMNFTISRIYYQSQYIITNLLNSSLAGSPYYLQLKVLSGGTTVDQYDASLTIESDLFTGTQIVQFAYYDGASLSSSANAYVDFTNSPPVCEGASLSIFKHQTATVNILCTDANSDPIYIQVASSPCENGNCPMPVGTGSSSVTGVCPISPANCTCSSGSCNPNPSYCPPCDVPVGSIPGILIVEQGSIPYFSYTSQNISGNTTIVFAGSDNIALGNVAYLNLSIINQAPTADNIVWNLLARRDNYTSVLQYVEVANATDPDGDSLEYVIGWSNCTNDTITFSGGDIYFVRQFDSFSLGTCEFSVIITDNDPNNPLSHTAYVTVQLYTESPQTMPMTISVSSGQLVTVSTTTIMSNDVDPLGGTLEFIGFAENYATISMATSNSYNIQQNGTECQTQVYYYLFTTQQSPQVVVTGVLNVEFLSCTCSKMLDIVFLVQNTFSSGSNDFLTLKNFLSNLVSSMPISPSQNNVGIIQFGTDIQIIQTLSSSSSQVSNSIGNLAWSQGSTNMLVALLSAEHMLLQGRSNAAKIIVVLFGNQPNWPCDCGSCSCFNVTHMCNHDPNYPYRDCNSCDALNSLQCNPCSDPVPLADKINNCKPGGNCISPLQGFWRIFAVGLGSSFIESTSGQMLIEELAYDGSMTFAYDWSVLSNDQANIIDLMQFKFCDSLDSSAPLTPYNETSFPGYYYCGQIVALGTENSAYITVSNNILVTGAFVYNSPDSLYTLFQITGCPSFGSEISSTSSSFTLWNLGTQGYVSYSNGNFIANSNENQATVFQMYNAPMMNFENVVLFFSNLCLNTSGTNLQVSTSECNFLWFNPVAYSDILDTSAPSPNSFPVALGTTGNLTVGSSPSNYPFVLDAEPVIQPTQSCSFFYNVSQNQGATCICSNSECCCMGECYDPDTYYCTGSSSNKIGVKSTTASTATIKISVDNYYSIYTKNGAATGSGCFMSANQNVCPGWATINTCTIQNVERGDVICVVAYNYPPGAPAQNYFTNGKFTPGGNPAMIIAQIIYNGQIYNTNSSWYATPNTFSSFPSPCELQVPPYYYPATQLAQWGSSSDLWYSQTVSCSSNNLWSGNTNTLYHIWDNSTDATITACFAIP
jgi:hypothetical protein